MSKTTHYIIDTNMLFGFDTWAHTSFSATFWDFLENEIRLGNIILLDVVVKEVLYKPELKAWCNKVDTLGLVTKISNEDRIRGVAINDTYEMITQSNSNSEVDTYILAYAERNSVGICSQEKKRIRPTDLYKIPDVCSEIGVPYISRPVTLFKHA